MKNFIQPGNVLTLVAPHDCQSGEVISVGSFTGVAAYDAKQGEEVETALTGVYEFAKGTGALAQGAPAYWDASAKKVSGSGDLLLGAVVTAAGADASVVRVRLSGVAAAETEE